VRRGGLVLLAVVLTVAGGAALLAFFASRDDAPVQTEAAPGQPAPGQTAPELRAGNVVLTYSSEADGAALRALAAALGGRPTVELRRAGQAVLVARRPGGVAAHAWKRRLRVGSPRDPALRDFVEYWLGRGDRQD
jgi:hypothetical protein